MFEFILGILTQSLTFLPLALGISISYHILRATDMTIDGSFVIGAAIFARFITLGYPPILATAAALCGGGIAGILVACIQRGGRVEPLLAGILATFILGSLSLVIMGKPNISLLNETTLFSAAFAQHELLGWLKVAGYIAAICIAILVLLRSRFGLTLRAFGDNANLLKRKGKNLEMYRLCGFALTNLLAASAGCITAQTVGYADISMGLGMTLTGIGAIILGQQILNRIVKTHFRIGFEFIACVAGIVLYFTLLTSLLRFGVDPIYLKMVLGGFLVLFLRSASTTLQGART